MAYTLGKATRRNLNVTGSIQSQRCLDLVSGSLHLFSATRLLLRLGLGCSGKRGLLSQEGTHLQRTRHTSSTRLTFHDCLLGRSHTPMENSFGFNVRRCLLVCQFSDTPLSACLDLDITTMTQESKNPIGLGRSGTATKFLVLHVACHPLFRGIRAVSPELRRASEDTHAQCVEAARPGQAALQAGELSWAPFLQPVGATKETRTPFWVLMRDWVAALLRLL